VPFPRAKHALNHERYLRHSCHATYDQDSPTCVQLATDLVISKPIKCVDVVFRQNVLCVPSGVTSCVILLENVSVTVLYVRNNNG